jgi:hypothetical protein
MLHIDLMGFKELMDWYAGYRWNQPTGEANWVMQYRFTCVLPCSGSCNGGLVRGLQLEPADR